MDQLVREIGVSQTPIRAALIRLENEGLVVKTHNVGYSAAPMPSRSRMEQIYELRMLLEPHAALLAAKRMTKDRKEELLEIVAGMEKPRAKSAQIAYGKFAVKDASFHEWIAQCSGNALIAESLSRLHAHMHLFRLRFHSQVTEDAIEEHSKIVQALTQGDGDKAKKAMLQHLSRSRDRVEPYFLSD